ncbi:RNA polymerase-associated protein HepA [Alloalcanivorax dieselolei B5]|uniref:RNA polymerase-associated protein RapA n=1 Tax=Alcanivorax dieselolei (strain DSM 16502 / CGMCC 1.3690 / MCCC 1A00001 / B-5) TaxID=930169 RepID=K0CCJ4_ALCDB|nr:RNA polymerase-associated protein RapA [Alloalcanivorax dieselolei]AFT69427.1 RNA polymerase-associated protein HepA [Alloalcanivorax dieselolei B5]GGJ92646.1 RNA polymerase-associated protein RapA [Alloalcanivorax dieselolei]
MTEFVPGQRWLSESETELGLGVIKEVDYRLVTVNYPAVEEERTYAKNNAPLSRVTFDVGETLTTGDGLELKVQAVNDLNGLLVYHAHPMDQPDNVQPVPESHLGHQLALNGAQERLLANQLSSNRWFELRIKALQAKAQSERSPLQGLRGARIDLIGHQLYIAEQVARRYAPRVLLADEVGLGKTIEAGLILHQQLYTGRAQRVLVVVPDALVHQWFVEMARRFNLRFSIFDESRLQALGASSAASIKNMLADIIAEETGQESTTQDNPFLSEQLVLCSTTFLEGCDIDLLAEAEWDLLVVDEAHHLAWSPEQPSTAYNRVEQVSRQARGLLLLTATPEQLGLESHFARLRLLDPDRYPSLDAFIEEQQQYRQVAELAGALHDESNWSAQLRESAAHWLPGEDIDESRRDAILGELLDRFGPGRVMFRNTRHNVAGFPQRRVEGYPLPLPDAYRLDEDEDLELALYPETAYRDDRWCAEDPRTDWLEQFLKQHRGEKVLVICAHRNTAIDLHAHCGYKLGLNLAVFHEDMDLIERDRAAAFFADEVDGAQALICSEIGSEGRNFQFAHHLVLLDLPRNPDLLEQRIGRLDRIGQTDTIQIHVPHFQAHAQQVLFHWYHEGMGAFEHTNPAGHEIGQRCGEALEQALRAPDDDAKVTALLAQTREVADELRQRLEEGRDRLLEMASCDREQADGLRDQLAREDGQTPMAFLGEVFEHYGVDQEDHSEHAWVLKPAPHLREPFPGLPEEGITVTDQRGTAIARDDMQFLTWEHPMVTGVLDRLLTETRGRASVALLKNPKIPAGTLLVETIYTVSCSAPRHLQLDRFLPTVTIRHLLDPKGRDLSQAIDFPGLCRQCHKLEKPLARKVVGSQKALLEKLLRANESRAKEAAEEHIDSAREAMNRHQQAELARLKALREKNPAVRDEEIEFLQAQTRALAAYLDQARVQLEAVRVIVAGN